MIVVSRWPRDTTRTRLRSKWIGQPRASAVVSGKSAACLPETSMPMRVHSSERSRTGLRSGPSEKARKSRVLRGRLPQRMQRSAIRSSRDWAWISALIACSGGIAVPATAFSTVRFLSVTCFELTTSRSGLSVPDPVIGSSVHVATASRQEC